MVKHTQTICLLEPTNCVSVFGHFVGLALKGSNRSGSDTIKVEFWPSQINVFWPKAVSQRFILWGFLRPCKLFFFLRIRSYVNYFFFVLLILKCSEFAFDWKVFLVITLSRYFDTYIFFRSPAVAGRFLWNTQHLPAWSWQ